MTKRYAMFALAIAGVLSVAPAMKLFAEDKPAAGGAAAPMGAHATEGFKSIFDGKTLDGWDGDPEVLVGEGRRAHRHHDGRERDEGQHVHPLHEGRARKLRAAPSKYKIANGNSGVQYRSKQLNEDDKYRIGGYQADFEAGKTYSGILYEEGGRGILCQRGKKTTHTADGQKEEDLPMTSEQLQAAIKPEQWNEYTLIADGTHLIHKINGNVTSETIDDSGKGAKSGILALQLHQGHADGRAVQGHRTEGPRRRRAVTVPLLAQRAFPRRRERHAMRHPPRPWRFRRPGV